MTDHSTPITELLNELKTDKGIGLTEAQAKQLLALNGENRLAEGKKRSNWQRFIDQFKDVMILILLAAAVISFAIACTGHDPMEFIEPSLIVLIVVMNAIIGMLQESKAEKALEALKNMSAPHARVVRDGREQVIDAAMLVPGDIIKLEAGDFIPADARLLEAASLKCEESALTGESVPSEKHAGAEVAEDAPLGDRENMVYSGCSVVYGRGVAVVTKTGMDTQMGSIADMLSEQSDNQTPLQHKLANLGKSLGFIALGACAVIFVMGLIDGIPVLEIFMTAVSLAVSAIPEGLPAIVTVVLSIGVQQLVKHNAIIRRLPAVETLGSASVICSDKTGTLTQNRMTLMQTYVAGENAPVPLPEKLTDTDTLKLLTFAALCCDGSIEITAGDGTIADKVKHIGDPTETALVYAAHMNGLPKAKLAESYPRVAELPFDSDRKLMTVVCKYDGRYAVIVKGAFDVLLSRCEGVDIAAVEKANMDMAEQALRVLGVGVKWLDDSPNAADVTSDKLERGLTLVGLLGMIDPPREEAKAAVATCIEAGIRPVMITGDHVVTASAIARQLGIMRDGDKAVTGTQLADMNEQQLTDQVRETSVYARVSPEDKIRIVKAWQSQGEVVSMTGDGVNDAPALKAADIGCAMGITGTDVAKGAADMTLTDDNFATIVEAVKQGRGIYDNIRKAVAFLLGTNTGELLTVFLSMLLWRQSPFMSMQLLWINLVTDSLPALALGMEHVEGDVMRRKPRPRTESIFAHGVGIQVILQGGMFAALVMLGFQLGQGYTGNIEGGRTLAFMIMALSQVFHAFNMRSSKSLFKIGPFSNKYMNGATLISVALALLILLVPPLATAFGMTMLVWWQYLVGLGLAIVPVLILELAKAAGLLRHWEK